MPGRPRPSLVLMRLVVVSVIAIAIGVGGSAAGIALAPALDARWETATTSHAQSVLELLGRSAHTPLLFVPESVTRDPSAPATLVVVLPGLGGIGREMAERFVRAAEADRWLLLAPSPGYDPGDSNESLQAADLRVDNQLVALIDGVMARPLHLAAKIDVVGFSRGAQSAHRFALRHPDRVAALASFSAGTYTMPTSPQPYPLGIGGFDQWNHLRPFDPVALRQVRVFVGVGTADTNPTDIARAWDVVGGTTRLERGTRFAVALEQLKVPTRFQTYAGVGHSFTPAMSADAIGWFTG